MPVKVVESNLNVLQAAKIRIRNVFANGCKIYLSFLPARIACAWPTSFMK